MFLSNSWKNSGFLISLFLMVEKFNWFPFVMSPKFNGSFLVSVSYRKGLHKEKIEIGLIYLPKSRRRAWGRLPPTLPPWFQRPWAQAKGSVHHYSRARQWSSSTMSRIQVSVHAPPISNANSCQFFLGSTSASKLNGEFLLVPQYVLLPMGSVTVHSDAFSTILVSLE